MTDGDTDTVAVVRDSVAAVNWADAIALGVLSFPVGYLLTAVLVFLASSPGGLLGVLLFAGFAFYSALNVPTVLTSGERIDYLTVIADPATASPEIPVVFYDAIPIVVLVGAGGLAVVRRPTRSNPLTLGLTIAGLALGFAGMAVVGSAAFVSRTAAGATARIALPETVVFGLAYPLLLGLLGATLVRLRDAFRPPG